MQFIYIRFSGGDFLKKMRGQSKKLEKIQFRGSIRVRAIFYTPDALTLFPPLIRKRRVGESGVLSGTAMLAQATI